MWQLSLPSHHNLQKWTEFQYGMYYFFVVEKKNGLWTFSTRGDVAYPLNSRVLCPAAHWAAVGVSVCPCPPVCLPFLPVHWLLFSPFLIIPQGTREDWLNWTWLSVSDWWLVCCLAEAVSLYANLSTFAAVCLSVCPAKSCLAPPRSAQPTLPVWLSNCLPPCFRLLLSGFLFRPGNASTP